MKTTPRYENAKWEDVPKKLQAHISKIQQTRKGLYIHGSVGSGKTHIIYAIGKHLESPKDLNNRIHVRVYNCTDLLREIRNDFACTDPYSKKHILESVLEFRGLLILDDIGSEKLSDWVLETFYSIVNKRYEDMIPTIFTSNLPLSELAERIGDRTVSRMVESCDVFELSGEDRRLKKHNKIKA